MSLLSGCVRILVANEITTSGLRCPEGLILRDPFVESVTNIKITKQYTPFPQVFVGTGYTKMNSY